MALSLQSGRASITLAISQPDLMSFLMMGKGLVIKNLQTDPVQERGKPKGNPGLHRGGSQSLPPQGPHQQSQV